jgi:hypothetical protein
MAGVQRRETAARDLVDIDPVVFHPERMDPGAHLTVGRLKLTHLLPPTNSPFLRSLERVSPKGPELRRWCDRRQGRIYTWDQLHGDVEVFNSRGRHLGSVDPMTGNVCKGAIKGRRIDV